MKDCGPDYPKIVAAVAAYGGDLLDRRIVYRARQNDTLTSILQLPGQPAEKQHCDIPVVDIVELAHINFVATPYVQTENGISVPPPTWREALDMVGYGWKAGALEYFEGDLAGKDFPARGSQGELELARYRLPNGFGPTRVSNGVHRAVGMVNWLIANQGSNAVAIGAETTNYDIDLDLLDQILDIAGTETVHALAYPSNGSRPVYVPREATGLITVGPLSNPELYGVFPWRSGRELRTISNAGYKPTDGEHLASGFVPGELLDSFRTALTREPADAPGIAV